MGPRPAPNHRRRRRQRQPATSSSQGSNSPRNSDYDSDDEPLSQRRPLTTPRTKRRSITHLNDLVRRQKEEQQQRRLQAHAVSVTSEDIERKMESLLLAPEDKRPEVPSELRLIRVAVRCRPRTSRRVHNRGDDDGSDDEDDLSDDDYSDGDRERLPQDSVVQYDFPDTSPQSGSPLPAISVPSHVLALGGHGPRRRFEFDGVFPPWKQQRDVYDAIAYDAIEAVLRTAQRTVNGRSDDGVSPLATAHATVVAYGQTGTGKTYTMGMLQHADPRAGERDHGIIPRAVVHILSRIHGYNASVASRQSGTKLVVSMSFLQIYLETIQDLLASPRRASQVNHDRRASVQGPSQSGGGLQVRLDPSTNEFYVAGLSEFPIESISDARALLELAAHNRVLAATARNKTSSRSHTLLTITIKRQLAHHRQDTSKADRGEEENDEDADDPYGGRASVSTVSFVDLAGSERVEGALHFLHATRKRQELRIREAKFINRSLSALGSVIAALSAQDDRRGLTFPPHSRRSVPRSKPGSPGSKRGAAAHIRFRDSQLTKLLQSRLMNGHGRLVLIATIDDRPANLTETLSTLKFASQCRRVDLSQTRTKADAVQGKRDATVLKQVLQEVKAMYEEREATLHRQYEARIAKLNDRVQSLQYQGERFTQSPAAYVALCSLTDITRRQKGHTVSEHPPLEAFTEQGEMVAYVADLYRELKEVLQTNDGVSLLRRRSSPAKQPSTRVSSDPTDPKPLKDVKVGRDSEHPPPPPPPPLRPKAQPASAVAVDDGEFQSLARFLFTSGLLQSMAVSSDEDDELHSQL